jgi:hypothetical protein
MVSSNLTSIGGHHPHTSWVMYTQSWTTTEKEFFDKKIIQIKKDFSNAKPNQIAFTNFWVRLNALQTFTTCTPTFWSAKVSTPKKME